MNGTDGAENRAVRLKRLHYRSWHRGFKEADLILGRFADAHLNGLSDEALSQYEALLGEADQDIYDWVTGRAPAPPAHEHDVMARLRTLHFLAEGRGPRE